MRLNFATLLNTTTYFNFILALLNSAYQSSLLEVLDKTVHGDILPLFDLNGVLHPLGLCVGDRHDGRLRSHCKVDIETNLY